MPSMTEPSGYMLESLRAGPDFTLYRGRQHGNPSPVLVVALTAEQPSPQVGQPAAMDSAAQLIALSRL